MSKQCHKCQSNITKNVGDHIARMSTVTDYPKEIFTFVQFVPGVHPGYQIEFLDAGTASAVFVDMRFEPGYDLQELETLYRVIKPAAEEEEQKKS